MKLAFIFRFVILGSPQITPFAGKVDSEGVSSEKGGCEDDDGTDGELHPAHLGESRKDVDVLPPILVDPPCNNCSEHGVEDHMSTVNESHDRSAW